MSLQPSEDERHLKAHREKQLKCARCEERFDGDEEYATHVCRPQRLRRRSRLTSLPACAAGIASPIKGEHSRAILLHKLTISLLEGFSKLLSNMRS